MLKEGAENVSNNYEKEGTEKNVNKYYMKEATVI
jgi:hypothetical protein